MADACPAERRGGRPPEVGAPERWWDGHHHMRQLLYEILYLLGLLVYVPKGIWRMRLPHRGWRMRLGRYSAIVRKRLAEQTPIWIHSVSVGETMAAQPLVQMLIARWPDEPLVLSAVTPSGFSIATKAVADHGVAVYFPLDLSVCVRRALTALHPRALLLMESELWPTVIHQAYSRGVPIAVVNGRISQRAFRRYQWVKGWLQELLPCIDLFLMQSQEDADRLLRLGASSSAVRVVGNLKWDASAGKRPEQHVLHAQAEHLGLNHGQRVIVAGSTHQGEEDAVLEAFVTLRATLPGLRLIIAPRHLERLDEIEGLIGRRGLKAARLSGEQREPWDVGLVDTLGQLQQFYGLASVVFIGGSLIPHGGQNPLEAASLGKPVVFGPFMHNFSRIAQDLLTHQAARQLSGSSELTRVLQELLADDQASAAMGKRALTLVEHSRGATERTLEALRPLLHSNPNP